MQKSLKPIDLTKILLPFENKWVVLSKNQKRVLGAGETLKEAEKQAQRKSKKYIFLKVPPFNESYVPTST